MKLIDVKMILEKHGLRIWQLAQQLNISRSHFYDLSHHNFKGFETAVRTAISDLIKKEND